LRETLSARQGITLMQPPTPGGTRFALGRLRLDASMP
jgi:hypothetical protein